MRLLIITQIMDKDDPVLGFFHEWVRGLSRQASEVTVICLKRGVCDLPPNVRVFSLGKEKKMVSSTTYFLRLIALLWRYRASYDTVFAHMNPEYVLVGAPLWKMLRKRIVFWYAHGAVSFKLRLAAFFSNIILTSTEEGFKLKSKKKRVIGQGIDTNLFSTQGEKKSSTLNLVTVGRISPSKDYETLLKACAELSKKKIYYSFVVIGGPGTKEQEAYLNKMIDLVKELKISENVTFVGPRSQKEIVSYLHNADIFLSAGLTGSLDKALLEAMSCGVITVSCNEAFRKLSPITKQYSFESKDFMNLVSSIEIISKLNSSERHKVGVEMRSIVESGHGLDSFVKKVLLESSY